MRVCIDIQSAIAQRAGVGRYTKSLVEHLGPLAGPDELRLFYFDFKRAGVPLSADHATHRAVRWLPGRVVQKSWKTLRWPPFNWFAGAADVYHFPNFVRPPLTRGKSVVTIHDVSFLRHPETTEERNLRYLTSQIRKTVEQTERIITDSEFSAREIAELLRVSPDRIQAIPLGLTHHASAPDGAAIRRARQTLKLDRPYLLFLGTLEPRKNIPFLIDVFERLTSFDGDLVIAGMKGWKYEPILERMQSSHCADRIRYLEYVDDGLLPGLYAGAELFVFPSLYEGFGFPPLEAMLCGTPVVSSNGGSLPEVLGDAAERIEGFDAAEWATRLGQVISDRALRERLSAGGRQRAAIYRWEETARRMWRVYREMGS